MDAHDIDADDFFDHTSEREFDEYQH